MESAVVKHPLVPGPFCRISSLKLSHLFLSSIVLLGMTERFSSVNGGVCTDYTRNTFAYVCIRLPSLAVMLQTS